MAPSKDPTQADREAAVQLTLVGLISGEEFGTLAAKLAELHPRYNTFPAEELLELAAEAIEESGATSAKPIDYEGIRQRYLPEYPFSGKSDHRGSHYALSAAAMIRGGVYPDLLGEIRWWREDDLWWFAFCALVIYLRIAAERTNRSIEQVARALADRRGVAVEA
jgi:hypothetical protein